MAMSKKDYEAVAAIFRKYQDNGKDPAFYVKHDLANLFAEDNPRFRREQFLAACRGESFEAPLCNGKTRKVNYGR